MTLGGKLTVGTWGNITSILEGSSAAQLEQLAMWGDHGSNPWRGNLFFDFFFLYLSKSFITCAEKNNNTVLLT